MGDLLGNSSNVFMTVLHTMLVVVVPIVIVLGIITMLRDRSRNKQIKKDRERRAARVYVENLANQMTYKINNGIPLSDLENVCNNKNYNSRKSVNNSIPTVVVNRIIINENKLRVAYNKYVEWLLTEYNKGHIGYEEYSIRLSKLNRRFDELLRQLKKSSWGE